MNEDKDMTSMIIEIEKSKMYNQLETIKSMIDRGQLNDAILSCFALQKRLEDFVRTQFD